MGVLLYSLLFAADRSESVDFTQNPDVSLQKQDTFREQEAAAEVVNQNNITAREFSLQTSEKYFELVSKNGDIWFTRSDKSWEETANWGEWLFFGSRRGDRVGIEAFHLANKTFLPVAEITVDSLASVTLRMRAENEFMYIELVDNSGSGSTHRCKLNEQKACSDMQLVFGEAGIVQLINPTLGVVVDRISQASAGIVRVRKLDLATGVATAITNLQIQGANIQDVAAVSADELVWIADSENGVVTQLQAVDFTGVRKFILPSQTFPILNAEFNSDDKYSLTNIEIQNGTQSVSFDLLTKQFGAPKAYVRSNIEDMDKNDIRKIVDIATRLGLPDDYVIRTAQ